MNKTSYLFFSVVNDENGPHYTLCSVFYFQSIKYNNQQLLLLLGHSADISICISQMKENNTSSKRHEGE